MHVVALGSPPTGPVQHSYLVREFGAAETGTEA
jgi:hypothetical protein